MKTIYDAWFPEVETFLKGNKIRYWQITLLICEASHVSCCDISSMVAILTFN